MTNRIEEGDMIIEEILYDDFDTRLDNIVNRHIEAYRRETEEWLNRAREYNDRGSRNEVYDTNRRRNDYTGRENERYERDSRRNDRETH